MNSINLFLSKSFAVIELADSRDSDVAIYIYLGYVHATLITLLVNDDGEYRELLGEELELHY